MSKGAIIFLEALCGIGLWWGLAVFGASDIAASAIPVIFFGTPIIMIVTGFMGSFRTNSARGLVLSLEALAGIAGLAFILFSGAPSGEDPFGWGMGIRALLDLSILATVMLLTSSIWGIVAKRNGGEKGMGFDVLFLILGLAALFVTIQLITL